MSKNVFLHGPKGMLIPGKAPSIALDELPVAIYDLGFDMEVGPYLRAAEGSYVFDYKLYGLDDSFIERTCKTYKSTSSNLGLLLIGLKGTGKTVTAKRLCNRLELPVIRVGFRFDGIAEFIAKIHQDVVIFVDEYEKCFNKGSEDGDGQDHELLKVMDGALTNEYRKVFILTSNTEAVSEYMLDRPSRIRYIKQYGNLKPEVYLEIVDDLLKNKKLKENTLNAIAKMSTITVDTVKKLIEEVNIFDQDPEEFMDFFNVKRNRVFLNIYGSVYDANNQLTTERPLITIVEPDRLPSDVSSRIGERSLASWLSDITADYSVKIEKINENEAIHWVVPRGDVALYGPHMWPGYRYEVVNNKLTLRLHLKLVVCAKNDQPYHYCAYRSEGKINLTNLKEAVVKDIEAAKRAEMQLAQLPILLNQYDARVLPGVLRDSYPYREIRHALDIALAPKKVKKKKNKSLNEVSVKDIEVTAKKVIQNNTSSEEK